MSAKFSGTCPFQLRFTSAPAAPDLAAASTKSCASKFSPCSATNNSLRLIVRESVLILLITTVPSPDSSEAPANCAICESLSGFILKLHRMILDRAARDLDVIKRDRVIGELLIVFVSLARNQDDVARTRQRNGAVDCLRAIDNFLVAVRAKTFFRFRKDRARVFLARIIRGNDGVIREAVRHL